MNRKMLMALLLLMVVSVSDVSAQSDDRPTVPVPKWNNNNPSVQSHNSQPLSTQPPTSPPASTEPNETLNELPLKNAPSAISSSAGKEPIKQLQVKPKQMKIKPGSKTVDSRVLSPNSQQQTTPAYKITPLPPTRKKVKNPATPEQK